MSERRKHMDCMASTGCLVGADDDCPILNPEAEAEAHEWWYAQPNDLVGGWCVMTEDKPPSEADPRSHIGDFLDQETAQHIASLHNAHLMRMRHEKAKRYRIPKGDWHTIVDTETGFPAVKVFPHGAGSFMGRDDMASGIAIHIEKMLNDLYPPETE